MSTKVESLALRSDNVAGGESVEAVVTLSAPAGANGATVTLSTDVDVASLPATVVIAAGQSAGTFAIDTRAVPVDAVVIISASFQGETKRAELVIKAPLLPGMVLKLDGSFNGGQTTPGAVELDGPAPEGGMTIRLSADSGALILPPAVAVPAGGRITTFNVLSREVNDEIRVTVTASAGVQTARASVLLRPFSFFSYDSAAGDLIGQGLRGKLTSNDAPFYAYVCDGQVSVFVQPANSPWWILRMQASPGANTLPPGTYEGSPFDYNRIWLNVSRSPLSCAPSYGQFVVHEAVYGSKKAEILRFRATFEQRCKANSPPLIGEISVYNPPLPKAADGCR